MSNVTEQVENPDKILTVEMASKFLGIAKSTLYKMVHERKVPFYKPNNKLVYFKQSDLFEYLTRYRFTASYEIEEQAINYVVNGKGGKSCR